MGEDFWGVVYFIFLFKLPLLSAQCLESGFPGVSMRKRLREADWAAGSGPWNLSSEQHGAGEEALAEASFLEVGGKCGEVHGAPRFFFLANLLVMYV